jgi:hypothetical protein
MKKIVLLSFCFATVITHAQNIKVENGRTFKISSTAITTGEMMGTPMNSDAKSVSTVKINAIDGDNYKATNTITKLTVTGNTMGQEISFDSDKKEDLESQVGQMIGVSLNKPVEITINKNTGKQDEVKDKEDEGGMGSIMGGNSITNIFFVLPASKKAGDKWTETIEKNGIKTITNYELKSIEGSTATIATSATIKGNTSQDMNGQSVDITIDSKLTSSFTVDTNTGILKQSNSEMESTNNMEMAGQSMVISNKIKTNTTVE